MNKAAKLVNIKDFSVKNRSFDMLDQHECKPELNCATLLDKRIRIFFALAFYTFAPA